MMYKIVPNISLIVICLCSILTSCSVDGSNADEPIYSVSLNLGKENDWSMSNEILDIINQYRILKSRTPFLRDTLYATAYAVDHTKYMIENDTVNHNYFFRRSNGLKYYTGATKISENIAYGYRSAESVVNAWLSSYDHKEVIDGDFSHIGFGIIKSIEDKFYYTLIFYK